NIQGTPANGVEFGINGTGLTLAGGIVELNKTGVLLNGQDVTISSFISANTGTGIDVEGTARNVVIKGSRIVSTGGGGDGILVTGGVLNVTIGDTVSGTWNIISNNQGNGIHLRNVTHAVQIVGNLLGTGSNGNGAQKN